MEDEKIHIQNLSRYQVCVVPQIPVIRENVLNKNIDRKCHIGTPRFPILGFWLVPGRGVFRGRVRGFIPLLLPPRSPWRWPAAFQYNWYSAKYRDLYNMYSQQFTLCSCLKALVFVFAFIICFRHQSATHILVEYPPLRKILDLPPLPGLSYHGQRYEVWFTFSSENSCPFATLETWKKLGQVNFRKDLWDRYWPIFPFFLSSVTVPEVFAKVNSTQSPSCI